MRLGTAIEHLVEAYKYASDKEWIQDKVAWALYHTWKEADRKTEPTISKMEQVDEPQTCDTCKYGEDKHRYAHICNECGVGINNYEPKDEPQTDCPYREYPCDVCDEQTDCPWK